ncbi:hypothetical protein ABPG72_019647 [Tetrahymena utriculariae]
MFEFSKFFSDNQIHIKIILAISIHNLKNERGQQISQLLEEIKSQFEDFNNLKESIVIIITQSRHFEEDEEQDRNDYLNNLIELLKQEVNFLKDLPEKQFLTLSNFEKEKQLKTLDFERERIFEKLKEIKSASNLKINSSYIFDEETVHYVKELSDKLIKEFQDQKKEKYKQIFFDNKVEAIHSQYLDNNKKLQKDSIDFINNEPIMINQKVFQKVQDILKQTDNQILDLCKTIADYNSLQKDENKKNKISDFAVQNFHSRLNLFFQGGELAIKCEKLIITDKAKIINLCGLKGDPKQKQLILGQIGEQGNPGYNGGNFMLIIQDSSNIFSQNNKKLKINVNGGKGGDGQEGGDGKDGDDGHDGEVTKIMKRQKEQLVNIIEVTSTGKNHCSLNKQFEFYYEDGKQGKDGRNSGQGGKYGKPGNKGYYGIYSFEGQEIDVKDIEMLEKAIKNGKNGKDGKPGKGGKGITNEFKQFSEDSGYVLGSGELANEGVATTKVETEIIATAKVATQVATGGLFVAKVANSTNIAVEKLTSENATKNLYIPAAFALAIGQMGGSLISALFNNKFVEEPKLTEDKAKIRKDGCVQNNQCEQINDNQKQNQDIIVCFDCDQICSIFCNDQYCKNKQIN